MPTLAVVPEARTTDMIEHSLQLLREPAGATLAPASVIAPIGGLNEACSGAPALPGLHAPTPRATSEPSLAATFSVDSTQLPEIGAVRGASEKQVSGLLVPPASLAPLPLAASLACMCPRAGPIGQQQGRVGLQAARRFKRRLGPPRPRPPLAMHAQ